MIRGLGIDLMDVERIQSALERHPRFLTRVYSPAEQEALRQRGAETAAGYFAAKEAVAKALGTGFAGFGMADVEILADGRGRPTVQLHGGAAGLAGGARVHLSISHDGGMALAFAVLEAREVQP